MSKYAPLRLHLLSLAAGPWHTTFEEIERILGFSLPPSSRSHQAWWANSQDNLPQHRAWLDAGWRTMGVDLSAGRVTFERAGPPRPSPNVAVASAPEPGTSSVEPHAWDSTTRTLICGIGLTWKPLGRVRRDEAGKLALPTAPMRPGLYCFRVKQGDMERRYIGETDNLARRFSNYRTPGPTQQTNVRINTILSEVLRSGAEVSASAVTDGWIDWGNGPMSLDLTSKHARCLLENAAIVESAATEIETLNRG